MKNTLVKYITEKVDIDVGDPNIKYISDYHSKSINIFELFDDIQDMIDIYQIMDNDRIERVSYELYGTTNYWDILVLLNDRNPLYDMPYDDGVIAESSEAFIELYKNFIYSNAPLINKRALELTEQFIEKGKDENEVLRLLYIIKPSRINDFISLIKGEQYI